MPTLLVVWGVITTLEGELISVISTIQINDDTGTISSYEGLVAARAFLGLVEGPMFPGILLYLSYFYTRKELSLRYDRSFSRSEQY